MKTVSVTAILDYCDGTLAFEARDPIGGHYVGAAVKPGSNGQNRFIVAGARPERLREFRAGDLDLRALMLEAPGGEWHMVSADGDPGEDVELEPQEGGIADIADAPGLLPLEGYRLEAAPEGDQVLKEARARHKVVLALTLSPAANRAKAGAVGSLLLLMQKVIEHACPETELCVTELGPDRIILEAADPPKMHGYDRLAQGLQRMDRAFAAAGADSPESEDRLAHSCAGLIRFLAGRGAGLSYSWAHPDMDASSGCGITAEQARRMAGRTEAQENHERTK